MSHASVCRIGLLLEATLQQGPWLVSSLTWLMGGHRKEKGYQDLGAQITDHEAFSPNANPNIPPQPYPQLCLNSTLALRLQRRSTVWFSATHTCNSSWPPALCPPLHTLFTHQHSAFPLPLTYPPNATLRAPCPAHRRLPFSSPAHPRRTSLWAQHSPFYLFMPGPTHTSSAFPSGLSQFHSSLSSSLWISSYSHHASAESVTHQVMVALSMLSPHTPSEDTRAAEGPVSHKSPSGGFGQCWGGGTGKEGRMPGLPGMWCYTSGFVFGTMGWDHIARL